MDLQYVWFILEVLKWVALVLSPALLVIARDGVKFGEDLAKALADGKLTVEEANLLHDDLGELYKSVADIKHILNGGWI